MPIYEYRCQSCGFKFEVKQKLDDGAPHCDNKVINGSVERICGGKCDKLSFKFSGTGIHLFLRYLVLIYSSWLIAVLDCFV